MVLVTKTNLPPLENGDRLTRVEFERRYRTMPEVKKAELVGRSSLRGISSTGDKSW